ncbi:MAG: hypothetical protein EBU84_08040 [Actinobacteria bacterium]|nr:hypothetical protein [Actinomycetota bacterium]
MSKEWKEGMEAEGFSAVMRWYTNRWREEDTPGALERLKWVDKHAEAIRSMFYRAFVAIKKKPPAEVIPEAVLDRMRAAALELLDGAQKPKNYKLPVPRIYMRLSDFARKNPAPLGRSKDVSESFRAIPKIAEIATSAGIPTGQAIDEAYRIAWEIASPEGFPPYPRRGGVYNADETHMLTTWVSRNWPVLDELWQKILHKEQELLSAGVSRDKISILAPYELQGQRRSLGEIAEKMITPQHYSRSDENYMEGRFSGVAGLTPQEWARRFNLWAEDRIPRFLEWLGRIHPALFVPKTTPAEIDKHKEELEKVGVGMPAIARLYGGHWDTNSWLPADRLAFYPSPYREIAEKSVDASGYRKGQYNYTYFLNRGVPFHVIIESEKRADEGHRLQSLAGLEARDNAQKRLFRLVREDGAVPSKRSLEKLGYQVKVGDRSGGTVWVEILDPALPGWKIWMHHASTAGASYEKLYREATDAR